VIYFIKIGHTAKLRYGTTDSNAYDRFASIQSACPLELEKLAVCDGDLADERALHERFAHLLIRGEWFRFTQEIRDHIAGFHKPVRRPRGWNGGRRAGEGFASVPHRTRTPSAIDQRTS
jgi:hypothetical protein